MKRLFGVLLTVLVLMLPAMSVTAQRNTDELTCTPDGIHAQVEAVFDDYSLLNVMDVDLETTLATLAELQAELETINAECTTVLYDEFIDDAQHILDLLREGNYVVYVRHTHTDRTQNDTDLASCETQRNLSEQGRDEARAIGDAYAVLDLPVSRLISTEYCRTQETAELAFGEPEIINRVDLEAGLDELLATAPEEGTNTFIVAHIGSITLTGITIGESGDTLFNEGDSLIFNPLGADGYEFVARIPLLYWGLMADLALNE